MNDPKQLEILAQQIKAWGLDLGFNQIGITDTDLSHVEDNLKAWLAKKYHGEMHYMQRHGLLRTHPEELVPGTLRVIVARMDYLPPQSPTIHKAYQNALQANISCYAQNRDYHKILRKRLTQLAKKIEKEVGTLGYRAFADSAPIMEKPLAQKAGLGWQGKNTMLINPKAGSWFFLGTLCVNLPLPIDPPFHKTHCGSCHACLDICPTKAIVAPFQIDARRCISYLTIELRGAIPLEFRKAIGNRIYGCDDCQIVCPWNKFAKPTKETAFMSHRGFDNITLVELFNWDEDTFVKKTEGSPIRRIGYDCWLRNIAVALGNTPTTPDVLEALTKRLTYPNEMVQEHVRWALAEHQANVPVA